MLPRLPQSQRRQSISGLRRERHLPSSGSRPAAAGGAMASATALGWADRGLTIAASAATITSISLRSCPTARRAGGTRWCARTAAATPAAAAAATEDPARRRLAHGEAEGQGVQVLWPLGAARHGRHVLELGYGESRRGARVVRPHERGHARRDLRAESRAVEDAVVPHLGALEVQLVLGRNIDA